MELSQPTFWMAGRLATNCVEISTDPSSLDRPGFWAVVNTFEGQFFCARFESVVDAPLPVAPWQGVNSSWISSQTQSEYQSNVEKIKEKIAAGDIYQVNLCRVLSARSQQGLQGLANRLQQDNPAPFSSYLRLPNLEIASASPELFLQRDGQVIKSTPIKGTSKIDNFGEKDKAENVMIVDLMRNDFGSICESGSVDVPRLLATQAHPGLYHLVSDVVGKLQTGISWRQILKALLPAGSISGAPKSSALKTIAEIEKTPRGPYCGVIGWVQGEQAVLSVGIRIFWSHGDGQLNFGTGAGITWASSPEGEWEETELKAKRLISIASGVLV
jgi:para-aminobenzoate synthetase component 1